MRTWFCARWEGTNPDNLPPEAFGIRIDHDIPHNGNVLPVKDSLRGDRVYTTTDGAMLAYKAGPDPGCQACGGTGVEDMELCSLCQ